MKFQWLQSLVGKKISTIIVGNVSFFRNTTKKVGDGTVLYTFCHK